MAKKVKNNDYARKVACEDMYLTVLSLFSESDMFTEKEKDMMRLFFRHDKSFQEIAEQYNMSAGGVRNAIVRTQESMKSWLRRQCVATKQEQGYTLNLPLKNFQGVLGVRVVKRLPCCDIKTVGDLMGCSPSELFKIKDIGHISIKKIIKFLKSKGLKLQDDPIFYQRYADKYDK